MKCYAVINNEGIIDIQEFLMHTLVPHYILHKIIHKILVFFRRELYIGAGSLVSGRRVYSLLVYGVPNS